VNDDLRAKIGQRMLRAIELTWEHVEAVEPYNAPFYDRVIREGCESYLAGTFCLRHDCVSLAIALLTVARQAVLQDADCSHPPEAQEPLS
jgi:hypothetical protein